MDNSLITLISPHNRIIPTMIVINIKKLELEYKPKGVVEPEPFPEALSLRLPGGLDQLSPVSLSGLGDESVVAGR